MEELIDRGEERRRCEISFGQYEFEKMAEGQQNLPHPHYVLGSVLGAGNTVVSNTDTWASRSVGPALRTVAWIR